MPSLIRTLVVAVVATIAIACPSYAATPSSASLSLSNPTTTWTGTAPGYLMVSANGFVSMCEAPFCDSFTLEVKEVGDLAISATANSGNGFTLMRVVRPGGKVVSNESGSGNRTAQVVIKKAAAGTYTVQTHTNRPATADATYRGLATLTKPSTPRELPPLGEGKGEGGPKDATVIAIVDSSFNPYHWDFLASKMPQASNDDVGDDLPLDRPASDWLSGFKRPDHFRRLNVTLEHDDAKLPMDALRDQDEELWSGVAQTTAEEENFYWLPGTKIIGAATFGAEGKILGANNSHGFGTTSAAAGNLHGTCPECLLVVLQYDDYESGERAIEWAMSQPWIDIVSNSYGFGELTELTDGAVRDNTYDRSNTEKQREASERGQSIVFSAGNGFENAFLAPNPTTYSSQKGPDWIVTVGAVSPPEDGHYEAFVEDYDEKSGGYGGAGKFVDVASLGSDYPTGYESDTVGGTGSFGFSGTSNAAPVVAGTYARSLYTARASLAGKSRKQRRGVIATGDGDSFQCGDARPGCELRDGKLTAGELRTRLFHGAVPTGNGLTVSGQLLNPTLPPVGEETLLAEGHGTYYGRVRKNSAGWEDELFRISGPLTGAAQALDRPDGEREWMVVDSYCRQKNWGKWTGGYYIDGKTELPGPDAAWPLRSAREQSCPGGPHRTAERHRTSD